MMKTLSLAQKVYVVKNYYHKQDMFAVQSAFNTSYKVNTTNDILEIFFALITQFELTGSITQTIQYKEVEPKIEINSPKKRGRKPKTHQIILKAPDSDDDEVDHFQELDLGIPPEGSIVWAENCNKPTLDNEKVSVQKDGTTKVKKPRITRRSIGDQLKCMICQTTHPKECFQDHMLIHDCERNSADPKCPKGTESYNDPRLIIPEIGTPTIIPTVYKCKKCTEEFATQGDLQEHTTTVHKKTEEAICDTCGAVLKSQKSLRSHQRLHSGEKAFKCAECGEAFISYGPLKCHMKKHEAGSYRCTLCDKSFVFKVNLNLHMKEHTNVKQFACHLCNRTCATATHLRSHIKILHKIELTISEIESNNYIGDSPNN